ncbi:MAG: hypothetical protein WC346_11900 [Methanogenium sp.]|jgi:hypothetical protein
MGSGLKRETDGEGSTGIFHEIGNHILTLNKKIINLEAELALRTTRIETLETNYADLLARIIVLEG